MRHAISTLAAVTLATPAAAQVTITVESPAWVRVGESVRITVSATADPSITVGTVGFATAVAGVGSIVQGSFQNELAAVSPPGGFTLVNITPGEIVYEGFEAFPAGQFGPNDGIGAGGIPEPLFSFEILATTEGTIDIVTGRSPISLLTGANDGGFIVTNFEVDFGGVSVLVIPSPAPTAALALGALVAARRRRRP